MSMGRGFLLLLLLFAGGVMLWLRAVPAGLTTPGSATRTLIDAADRTGYHPSAAADAQRRLLPENNPSGTAAPASPIARLIGATGFPCARVIRIAPIRAGDGIWAITCRDHAEGDGAERRFRVDTRQGRAIAES